MALLSESARERAVVVVLHDLHAAALYCDRLVLMAQGQVLAQGAPEAVLVPESLAQAYGEPIDTHVVRPLRFFTGQGVGGGLRMLNGGMRIDLAGWSREATQGDTRECLALFETAKRLGFDGVWFHEFRLLADSGPYPSPLLLARTERLRVGTSALVLPLHDPLLLAEEVAQLAYQSHGRIDVGVGRGTDASTLRALGIDAAQTRLRFERGCAVLRQQVPQVPLYVAGSTAETIGFAVENDIPLLLSLEPPETTQLRHASEALQGRSSTLLARSTLARYDVCIGASQAEVQAQLNALWPRLQERRAYFVARRDIPSGQVPAIDPATVLREQFIHGDPAQCHAQIVELHRRTAFGALRCVFNASGLYGNAQALDGMTLFAQEVLPALRSPNVRRAPVE